MHLQKLNLKLYHCACYYSACLQLIANKHMSQASIATLGHRHQSIQHPDNRTDH